MKALGWMKPEYVLRPRQLLRRLRWFLAPPRERYLMQRLPWGLDIRVRADEVQGKAILHLGVIDLVVTEALCRLCEEGETCLDIGANIGYMTSVMASRVGPRGRVVVFEPHPAIYQELESNCSGWRKAVPGIDLSAHRLALSECRGTVDLEVPADFARNRGLCRVVVRSALSPTGVSCMPVACETLDNLVGAEERIGVAKMDVEGHEASVLRGGQSLLARGGVRDWVFEHHPDYPSPVTSLFEVNGYKVLCLKKGFFRPLLLAPAERAARSMWEPVSFLATRDPDRATARFKPTGWQSIRGR
jgi:FkbM family methyltransferase